MRLSDSTKVIDTVFHYSVIEQCKKDTVYFQAILKLAFDCVNELHQMELDYSDYDKKESVYEGPYAWGNFLMALLILETQLDTSFSGLDERGQPLKDSDLAARQTVPLTVDPEPEISVESILAQKNQESFPVQEELKMDLKIPGQSGKGASSEKDISGRSKTVVIEELGSKSNPSITPSYKMTNTEDGSVILYIHLPELVIILNHILWDRV
jgi:hypothetical protein